MAGSQILSLVWRRKLLFLFVSALVFSSIIVAILFWPKSYVATAKILFETRSIATHVGSSSLATDYPTFLATQIEVLKSSRVATRVIEDLDMKSNKNAVLKYQQERHENETFNQFITEHLKNGLTVEASQQGNVIDVSYRANDPVFAAQAANAFVKAFINVSQDLRSIASKTDTHWLELQLNRIDKSLSESQSARATISAIHYQKIIESQIPMGSAIALDEALPPPRPSSPKTFPGLAAAIVLAPLVGLLAVLLNEALDRRVRSRLDLEETTGVNVLCVVGIGRPSRTLAVFRTMTNFVIPRPRSRSS
jgi:uncharacterized protein involved in exopolysaccharide biosynthesis